MRTSVVIRTKDEEQWIERCLDAVLNQDYSDFSVVIVDSGSKDRTLELVAQYGITVSHYVGKYYPGRSLNQGTELNDSEFVAYLSAHCIPVNDKWLERLVSSFDDPSIAGVYGRQEPLPDSSDLDKRDLWTVFGKERKVQTKEFFFHNANSMIRRHLWEDYKFSEELPSIEDQAWARTVLAADYKIVYEPKASVFHYHGIHQNSDRARAERVVKVIELLKEGGEPW